MIYHLDPYVPTCPWEIAHRFVLWLSKHAGPGRYTFLGHTWRIQRVYVTVWLDTGNVVLYHDEGRRSAAYDCATERARKAVLALLHSRA